MYHRGERGEQAILSCCIVCSFSGKLLLNSCKQFTNFASTLSIIVYQEYELHIEEGNLLFAGVDYERILREAEKEADIVIWDGGNNDFSFYHPDLTICVADALREGHEEHFYP